ncbi:isocitrate lyase/PEP mutase family protein [Acidipila rosea]|uniref:2-methylisocitrate lyase-like PEP mutase family enzyme n=1 Tax=Acidipila rosea TaxID=768535 RepID=A0A4R1L564_9BACT|nr:isocitrate lyase/PEP mutase family protein [Acidipila rosea]MBW4027923.1 isocitrate lyase/PEP mutase family protein [Acidobacteriota bacterium]MBW4045296.1 isocitrate lyase/PEP mutase family protein [Acidobacteriota bacterium]TCK72133.1 2-methylisocitrate lyase-like PEP mutase family enzyme [Acidipila rosea]
MHSASQLRRTLNGPGLTIAPGAMDCLSAAAVEQNGFSAIYMTGMGTSASRLGLPDYGLATMTEMVTNASAMASTVNIPIIADADTGYGNELNMTRTVMEFERSGVAGIHIEDQVFPKKCGHLDRKQVIPRENYIRKIAAAVSARRHPDFLIIARTDANAVVGFEEAIARANAALDVGADLALVEAPESVEQLLRVPQLVHGPCVLNILYGGRSPLLSFAQIEEAGYKLAFLSDVLLGSALAAYDSVLRTVHGASHSTSALNLPHIVSPREVFRRLGSERWDELRGVEDAGKTPLRRGA